MLLASAVLLSLGLSLPVVEVNKLLVFESRASLVGLTLGLMRQGEIVLGVVVGLFSVAFPIGKLAVLIWLWLQPDRAAIAHSLVRAVEWLGRWSMLDVLVLALVVFSVKASGWATAASQPGLYCFVAAVLLTLVSAARLRRQRSD